MLKKQAQDGVTPKALRDRPVLDFRQTHYFNAYQEVSGSRRASMAGAMPIPISELRAYCDLYKIHNVETIETLVARIQYLDGVYLDHVAEKAKQAAKKPKR